MERKTTPEAGAPPLARRLPDERAGLLAYVRHLVTSVSAPLDPEDILQDVMERALRYAHSFDAKLAPDQALAPWLRRTALRLFLDQRDRWRRDPTRAGPSGDEPGALPPSGLAEREHVDRLLAGLSLVERTVLRRFHGEGWTVAELSNDLGLPQGTVKSHLHRARSRLREAHPEGGLP